MREKEKKKTDRIGGFVVALITSEWLRVKIRWDSVYI